MTRAFSFLLYVHLLEPAVFSPAESARKPQSMGLAWRGSRLWCLGSLLEGMGEKAGCYGVGKGKGCPALLCAAVASP